MLRNDFARYNLTDDESDELDQDDYGWKIISTDVFRFPPHKSLLCAVLGTVLLNLCLFVLCMYMCTCMYILCMYYLYPVMRT